MRSTLSFETQARSQYSSWSAALTGLIDAADKGGVLVMVSGIVGSNTRRKLDTKEFRGFCLIDDLAPTVFVNGSDSKAAQIFTLAHELAHVWLGEPGVDDVRLTEQSQGQVEDWCNKVAAEFLVPAGEFRDAFDADAALSVELQRLARTYRVSTLVILRRIRDVDAMQWDAFITAYVDESRRVIALMEERGGAGGGNFYNTTPTRTSKRFARAVITSAYEGQTLFRDAARLLGFRKQSTLDELGHHLGVI